MRPTLLLCCLLTVAAIAGCGRDAPGVILTEDGMVVANSPAYHRRSVAANARRQLDEQLGGHWRSAVDIAELPDWDGDQRAANHAWLWAKATVTVTLVGDGAAPLPESADAVRDAMTEYMRGHVDHPATNLTVTVATVVDAARFATSSNPSRSAADAALGAPSANSGPRQYTVEAGDTLAVISAVFYGSAKHWKVIRDGNPGLDPEALRVGQVITIPPLPQTAP